MSVRGAGSFVNFEPSLIANLLLVYFMLHALFECVFSCFRRFGFLVAQLSSCSGGNVDLNVALLSWLSATDTKLKGHGKVPVNPGCQLISSELVFLGQSQLVLLAASHS